MYQLTLNNFEGPLNLLLNVVEEQKLSINEISLAHIADQYVAYLKSAEELSKEELAMFLVIAATLMLLKSRSLLPQLHLTEEEELDVQELQLRLRTLQFFKTLASTIGALERRRKHCFGREAYSGMQAIFLPPEQVTKTLLGTALRELIALLPSKEELPTDTLGKVVSLEEKMKELWQRLQETVEMSFDEMKRGTKEKVEVIISFLAILELIKQGMLLVEQKGLFGTIHLKKHE